MPGDDGARDRVVSVGVSRLFRLVALAVGGYRVEQATRGVDKKWKWVPLALSTDWSEGHGCLHQMQGDYGDAIAARQQSFRSDRYA